MNSYDYFVTVYNKQGRIISNDRGIFNRIDAFVNEVENYFDSYKDEIYQINLSIRNRDADGLYYDRVVYTKGDVYNAVRALT